MRDHAKIINLAKAHPERSSDCILNSVYSDGSVTPKEALLEYRTLELIRTLSPESINRIENICKGGAYNV